MSAPKRHKKAEKTKQLGEKGLGNGDDQSLFPMDVDEDMQHAGAVPASDPEQNVVPSAKKRGRYVSLIYLK